MPILAKANSWAELHANLAAVGLRFERKGSGAVIFVGDVAIKASSVDRAFSLGNLQKRLGDFEAGDYTKVMPSIKPQPVSPINQKLWREYRAECEAIEAKRGTTEPGETTSALRQMKERHHERQATLHDGFRGHPRCILNIARHFLKLQQQEELRQLWQKTPKAKSPRRPRFEDWLRKRGLDYQADRWRYRRALEALPKDFRGAPTVMATPTREPLAAYAAYRRSMLQAVPDAEPDRLNAYIACKCGRPVLRGRLWKIRSSSVPRRPGPSQLTEAGVATPNAWRPTPLALGATCAWREEWRPRPRNDKWRWKRQRHSPVRRRKGR